MKTLITTTIVGILITLSGVASAQGDAQAGAEKSGICAACHGPVGISRLDIWPNLAGQNYGYLVKQLNDFRKGTRPDPVMTPVAMELSEQDIENLAAYYSSQ